MLQLSVNAAAKDLVCHSKDPELPNQEKQDIIKKGKETALILGWFLALLQFSHPFLWSYSLILPVSFMIQYVNINSNRFCLLNLQSDFASFNFQTSKIYGF